MHWLGLGSNLLVRDGGIRGAVIATSGLPRELERLDERRVRASAGLACMLLAKRCVRWQLGPAAFFAGIPGTVGGALAMNAGAFGGETWTHVESVTTIDRRGEMRERPRAEFEIGYRSVRGPAAEWFLGATFRFEHDAVELDGRDQGRCSRAATRRSRSASRAAARCSAIRPATSRAASSSKRGHEGRRHRRRDGLGQARELHPERR